MPPPGGAPEFASGIFGAVSAFTLSMSGTLISCVVTGSSTVGGSYAASDSGVSGSPDPIVNEYWNPPASGWLVKAGRSAVSTVLREARVALDSGALAPKSVARRIIATL